MTALEKVETRLPRIEAAIGELRQVEDSLVERRDGLCADIRQRCAAIVAAVQQRQAELEAECHRLSSEKERRLIAQREKLQTTLEVMQAGCASARDTVERGAAHPASTLYARDELLGDLQRMQTQPLELQPTESARLEFVDTKPAIMQEMAAFGGISGASVLAANCTAEGRGLSSAKVGAVASFTVQAVDSKGAARTEGGERVEADLLLERGGAAADAVEVADNSDGTYCCAYTACREGRALLHVCVRAAPIRGSPFTVVCEPAVLEFTENGSDVTITGSKATKTGDAAPWKGTNSMAIIGVSLTDGVHCWEVQYQGQNVAVGICSAQLHISGTETGFSHETDGWFMNMHDGRLIPNRYPSAGCPPLLAKAKEGGHPIS